MIQFLKESKNQYQLDVGSGEDYLGYSKTAITEIPRHQPILELLHKVEYKCISEIAKLCGNSVFPEMTIVAEWPIGGFQDPHLDTYSTIEIENFKEGEIKPHREWTCILNLNSNFRGGQTFFPDHPDYPQNEPETGSGIIFQGIYVPHGVHKVRRNSRYTVALWFTQDEDRINQFDKLKKSQN